LYTLSWKNPALNTNKAAGVQVPVGSVISNKASIRFTGKGAANYGQIQQENLMRLLENFADASAPLYPTVGQQWFDTSISTLKICTATEGGVKWRSIGGVQVTAAGVSAPTPAAIGDIWAQTTGTGSVVLYIYTGLGRFGGTSTTIGGWSQVYPIVEVVAGREEYDAMLSLVNQLIGPSANGGSNALGNLTPALSNLPALDTDYQTKFSGLSVKDVNVLTPVADPTTELTVDVTSQDWDLLLAAAKFAVSRLDLPAAMIDDISPIPFVYDGRQAPTALTSLPSTNVMYPSLERRSNRHFGIVTLIRAFTETMNVLTTALANRYSIKGINGSTGVNTSFAPNVTVTRQGSFTGAAAGATSGVCTLRFRWNTAAELNAFLFSGGAIQITATHVPGGSGTAADTTLKTLFDSRGVIRITADKTRFFSNTAPLTQSVPLTPAGISGTTSTSNIIASQTLGSETLEIGTAIATPTGNYIEVRFHFFGTGPSTNLNGTTTVAYDVIRDTSTYVSGANTLNAFPAPLAYSAADKISTSYIV